VQCRHRDTLDGPCSTANADVHHRRADVSCHSLAPHSIHISIAELTSSGCTVSCRCLCHQAGDVIQSGCSRGTKAPDNSQSVMHQVKSPAQYTTCSSNQATRGHPEYGIEGTSARNLGLTIPGPAAGLPLVPNKRPGYRRAHRRTAQASAECPTETCSCHRPAVHTVHIEVRSGATQSWLHRMGGYIWVSDGRPWLRLEKGSAPHTP